jgi:hypothetical protein
MFGATFLNTLGNTSDNYGIFRGNGGVLTEIAREGQAAPGGNGYLSPHEPRSTSNNGYVAFRAGITGTAIADDHAIFRAGTGPLVQILRKGQPAPDGNGSFEGLMEPVVNDLGQAVFQANLTGTSGSVSDDEGIFRGDGVTLTQIARAGQTSPDGNGKFSSFFGGPDINGSGQVAFAATLTDTIGGSTDNMGVFIYDDSFGIRQIVRTRQTILERLVVDLRLQTQLYDLGTGLNVSGQVAYWFKLADGYEGIAIWSPTTPGDYNVDNSVDAADYVLWRKSDGSQGGYQNWRSNFGNVSSGAAAQVAGVPEPSTFSSAILLCAIALRQSSHRARRHDGGGIVGPQLMGAHTASKRS